MISLRDEDFSAINVNKLIIVDVIYCLLYMSLIRQVLALKGFGCTRGININMWDFGIKMITIL